MLRHEEVLFLIRYLHPREQSLDLHWCKHRQRLIVTYKTSYYSFYLPIALGMRLGGITSPRDLSVVGFPSLPAAIESIAVSYKERLRTFLSFYEPSKILSRSQNLPSAQQPSMTSGTLRTILQLGASMSVLRVNPESGVSFKEGAYRSNNI